MLFSKLWFRRTSLCLLALLIALPWLVSDITRYFAVDWIEQQGVERAEIERLWINPYTGVVELQAMTLVREDQAHEFERLYLNFSWWALWSKKVRVTELSLSGLSVQLVEENGERLINGMTLAGVEDDKGEPAEDVDPEGESSEWMNSWHFAIDKLHFEDVAVELKQSGIHLQGNVDSLNLTPLDTGLNEKSKLDLLITIERILLSEQKISASTQLNYSADIELKKDSVRGWSSLSNGRILIEDTQLSNSEFLAQLARIDLGLNHKIDVGETLSYNVDVEAQLSDLTVTQPSQKETLVDLKAFSFESTIDKQAVSINQLALSELSVLPSLINDSSDSDKSSNLIENMSLTLDRMNVLYPAASSPVVIEADSIQLTSGDIYLSRNSSGEINQLLRLNRILDTLNQTVESTPESHVVATASSSSAPLQTPYKALESSQETSSTANIQIHEFHVNSGVAVHFYDQSVTPAFTESLVVDFIDVENVTLTEPMSIAMKIDLSHGASIGSNIEASVSDFSAKGDLSVKGYELLAVSAYSEVFTGYALESGQINLASDFEVADQIISSLHQVDVDYLNLRAEHQDSVEQFAHRLTMPLDQAVDLLRDGNNHIHLEVPVNGEMNNPDVNLQQIINTALKGAMKKASMAVLSTLLQPYGAMISIAQMAGEEMTKVHLAPVTFQPGQAVLDSSSRDYVEKVGGMIRERPSLKVKLCGVTNAKDNALLLIESNGETPPATDAKIVNAESSNVQSSESVLEAELPAVDTEKMQALGHERALAVKAYLENDLGVNSSQLFMCLPKHMADESSGVELSI